MIVAHGVLNGRIYRAAFVPLLFTLAIAGFSLNDRPAPLTSGLAPGAFEGARAFADLQGLAARFPDRRPGSRGDDELAGYIAGTLKGLGGTAAGGFSVQTRTVRAQTIEGERTLETVIAQRPGTSGEQPLVVLAHRDAAGRGARGELSATAVLLELARVFASSETQRTIVLVSSSGGSGGNAGAADFANYAGDRAGGQGDAAIVLGDIAGTRAGRPIVSGLSEAPGWAPQRLQRTVTQAIEQQAGMQPATPTPLALLMQLVFPLTAGEQGPLNARGLPAVLVQAGGELPPPAEEPVSATRLEALGRAVLSAIYALDAGGEVAIRGGAETALPIEHKLIPEWAMRLVLAALLLPPLLVTGDELARLGRRRRATAAQAADRAAASGWDRAAARGWSRAAAAGSLAPWLLWVLACALPFLACALFAMGLGALGAIAAPFPPVVGAALPFGGSALEAVVAVLLVLLLAWLAWPVAMRRASLPPRPTSETAGLAVLLVLGALTVVTWAIDPFTALLLLPALHLWLVLLAPAPGPGRAGRPASWVGLLVLLGLAPLGLLIAFYASRLGLGPGGVAHTALLLLAGGRVGLGGAVLWSIAAGALVAALCVAFAPAPGGPGLPGAPGEDPGERELAPIRGSWADSKSFYAGPGSLGGTDSALRR
jgi:hypothetical protein